MTYTSIYLAGARLRIQMSGELLVAKAPEGAVGHDDESS